jgi:hypothetical protein
MSQLSSEQQQALAEAHLGVNSPEEIYRRQLMSKLSIVGVLSIVPISLYAFSKFKKYDQSKTFKVVAIGSVIGITVFNFATLGLLWKELLEPINKPKPFEFLTEEQH